jgi:DNA-directed RNA polymerase specialized sigma24 family protein
VPPSNVQTAGVAVGAERRIQDVGVRADLDARSDEELLCLAARDRDAFEELYRRCVDKTVGFASRRCQTPEQVHDLVAATWLEAIDASVRFDPARGKAVPWLLGVMANLANDRRRRSARGHEALRGLGGLRVLDDDDVLRLEEALDAIPAQDREALELVAFGGLGQEEAASALGVAPATFRMRLARARRRLRATAGITQDLEVIER